MMARDVDILALQIAKAIDAIPPEWPRPRKTAHAQVLIGDALRAERAAMQDAFNAAINFKPLVTNDRPATAYIDRPAVLDRPDDEHRLTPDPDLDRTLSAVNDAINQPGE